MSKKRINPKVLDEIVEKMIDTVGKSKDEIFQIGESCRNDVGQIYEELKQIKELVKKVIDEEEKLDREVRRARKYLSEVSLHFSDYSEEEVRDAYEYAHRMQLKLSMTRQLEKQLRERRDDLERRLVGLQEMIERSDRLVSQVNIVLNYLSGDMKNVSDFLQHAKEKQEFGLKIIEAQEEERKRLSREIHDGPAQMLANMIMRSDLIEKIARERGMDEALLEMKRLKKTVRDALYEVRHIIYDLRPMALDDLGLVPTLKKYLQTVEEYSRSAKITFTNVGQEKRLDSKMEVALFRLVQESVQNALKHAKAKWIQVKLEMMDKKIVTLIKDDGIGFDPEEKKEGSFGLRGMKERVELLDGELQIDSKIGKGTRILITVPLQMEES
ncbi:sensor histidine kinase [Fervidibacillus albus]|uniref:Signal transduction histidine-protein kinase/phosphatase DegS n=1 Tax=Fervidibacillus albus TaxID=2980026 RepID=A0A9E8RUN4_9BACI|nr:sensor histidine kinase [Fervidibacillus albus]WAA09780.1 sensor histidine kinase [Fervidibacillus albus]